MATKVNPKQNIFQPEINEMPREDQIPKRKQLTEVSYLSTVHVQLPSSWFIKAAAMGAEDCALVLCQHFP